MRNRKGKKERFYKVKLKQAQGRTTIKLTCSLCHEQFSRELGQVKFAKKDRKTDLVFCQLCWKERRAECMSAVNRKTRPNAGHGVYQKECNTVKLNNSLAQTPRFGKIFEHKGSRYVCTGLAESPEQGKNLVVTKGHVFFEESIKWVGDEYAKNPTVGRR